MSGGNLFPDLVKNKSGNLFPDLVKNKKLQIKDILGIGKPDISSYITAGILKNINGVARSLPDLSNMVPDKLKKILPYQEGGRPSEKFDADKLMGTDKGDSKIGKIAEVFSQYYLPDKWAELPTFYKEMIKEYPKIAKYAANYAGKIGQSSGISAIQNVGQREKNQSRGQAAAQGALFSAGLNTAFLPFAMSLSSKNPIVRAIAASGLGAAAGYGAEKMSDTNSNIPAYSGAGVGALAEFVMSKGKSANELAIMNMLKDVDPKESKKYLSKSRDLGLSYSLPAEASDSPLAAKALGKVGKTDKGLVLLHNKSNERLDSENKAIKNLLDIISPNSNNFSQQIRHISNQLIDKSHSDLQEAVYPFYKKAETKKISPNQLKNIRNKDAIVNKAINEVANDPIHSEELNDVQINSVKFLDLVSRKIGEYITKEQSRGNGNRVRLLVNSQKRLQNKIDSFSPDYKKARQIFNQGSETIDKLKNSIIGTLANVKDIGLKNIPSRIFDPGETDINVLKQVRERIKSIDPKVWYGLVRNELERRMKNQGSGGSSFYKSVLKNDRDFKQFYEALDGNPTAQRKLLLMREVFKNLIPHGSSARTTAHLARTSMTESRGGFKQDMIDLFKKLTGGSYDHAAAQLVTRSDWDKEFKKLEEIKNDDERSFKAAHLLSKINNQISGAMTGNNS